MVIDKHIATEKNEKKKNLRNKTPMRYGPCAKEENITN